MSSESARIIIVCELQNIIAIDVVRALISLGFKNIKTCNSGIDLLEYVNEEKPDIILSNIHLKTQYEGLTALKEIHRLYPDINIIFFTSHSDLEIKFIGADEITSFILKKPYSIDSLQLVIEDCLKINLSNK